MVVIRSRKTFIKATEVFAFALLFSSSILFSISSYLEYQSFRHLYHGVDKERYEIRSDLNQIQKELAGYALRGQTCEEAVTESLNQSWWWDGVEERLKWSQELNEAEVSAFYYINAAYMSDFWLCFLLIVSFSGFVLRLPSVDDYDNKDNDDNDKGVQLEEEDSNESSSSSYGIVVQQTCNPGVSAESPIHEGDGEVDDLSTPEEDARYYYTFLVECYFKSWTGRLYWLMVLFLLTICLYRHIDQAFQLFKLPPHSWVRLPAYGCFITFIIHIGYWLFWANAWLGGYLLSWAYRRITGRPKIAKDDPHAIPLNNIA